MMIFKQQIHVLSYSDPEVSHTSLAYFSMSSSILLQILVEPFENQALHVCEVAKSDVTSLVTK